jgi:Zn-dependent protease with chaperone function
MEKFAEALSKLADLLSKLLDNYPLATLFLGTLLVALSGMDKWPLGSITVPVSNESRLFLLIIGLILTVVSILSLFFKDQLANLVITNRVIKAKNKLKEQTQESNLAAKWLLSQQQSLLQSIKNSEFSSKSLEEFRSEIKKYLDLLIESLNNDLFITPKRRDINFHIKEPLPYVNALNRLKKEIKDQYKLNGTELKTLNTYIDQLVEDIKKESSSS